MLGAIIGDIVGSRWEFYPTNDYDFEWLSKVKMMRQKHSGSLFLHYLNWLLTMKRLYTMLSRYMRRS